MKKNDRIRAAKTIALCIHNQRPYEDYIEQDRAIIAEGCTLTNAEGVFRFVDKDGEEHVLVPSKKQVIAYKGEDYAKYRQLDWHLAKAKTQEDVYAVACALDEADLPASLKKIIEQGIDQTITTMWHDPAMTEDDKAVEAHKVEPVEAYEVETPFDNLIIDTSMMEPLPEQTPEQVETPKAETPKKEKTKAEKPKAAKKAKAPKAKKPKKPAYVTPAMRDLAAKFEGVTFSCKGEGCCIWAEGDKAKHGKALEKVGFVWSGKRNAYYRKAA